MLNLRQAVLYSMIPLNLALTIWVLMGRALFGVEIGWRFMFVLVFIVPVLVVCLTVSTVLAYRQKRRPIRLSGAQAWFQLGVWAALLLGGAALIDYVDADLGEPRESVLIELAGASLTASHRLMYVAAALTVVTWSALMVLLIQGLPRKDRRAQSL